MNARFMGPLVGSWSKNVPLACIYTTEIPPILFPVFAFTGYLSLTLILFGLDGTNYTTLHNTPLLVKCLLHTDFRGVDWSRTMRNRQGRELSV